MSVRAHGHGRIPDALIELVTLGADGAATVEGTAWTDAEGVGQVSPSNDGRTEYYLRVSARRGHGLGLAVRGPFAHTLEDIEVDVDAAARVTGRILDGRTGRGIVGARAQLMRPCDLIRTPEHAGALHRCLPVAPPATSDGSGDFQIEDVEAGQDYYLVIYPPSPAGGAVGRVVRPDATSVNVTLSDAKALTVIDPTGQPVPGARVDYVPERVDAMSWGLLGYSESEEIDHATCAISWTDRNGVARYTGAYAGGLKAHVRPPAERPDLQRAWSCAVESGAGVVRLARTMEGRVSGTVRGTGGRGGRVVATWRRDGRTGGATVPIGPGGAFEVTGVPPGEVRLRALADGAPPGWLPRERGGEVCCPDNLLDDSLAVRGGTGWVETLAPQAHVQLQASGVLGGLTVELERAIEWSGRLEIELGSESRGFLLGAPSYLPRWDIPLPDESLDRYSTSALRLHLSGLDPADRYWAYARDAAGNCAAVRGIAPDFGVVRLKAADDLPLRVVVLAPRGFDGVACWADATAAHGHRLLSGSLQGGKALMVAHRTALASGWEFTLRPFPDADVQVRAVMRNARGEVALGSASARAGQAVTVVCE